MKKLLKKIKTFLHLSKKDIPSKRFDIVEFPKNLTVIVGEVYEEK